MHTGLVRELLRCCSCNIYACWPSVLIDTNNAAVQICLLFECCCKIDACWVLPLNPACKLVLCFSICHYCWYGVSLSAVPAGVLPHYRPYLLMWCLNISLAVLVWCLSIGHAFWCGASLQAMPSGVVPNYQPCLLVCFLTIIIP